jgi:hypothetical protein
MAQNLLKDAFWKSLFRTFSDLENSKFSLRKSWIFLEKSSKICLSPSEYKLESWNFAWTYFARLSRKLHTQVLNFLEFAQEFSWRILKFSSKMCLSPSGYYPWSTAIYQSLHDTKLRILLENCLFLTYFQEGCHHLLCWVKSVFAFRRIIHAGTIFFTLISIALIMAHLRLLTLHSTASMRLLTFSILTCRGANLLLELNLTRGLADSVQEIGRYWLIDSVFERVEQPQMTIYNILLERHKQYETFALYSVLTQYPYVRFPPYCDRFVTLSHNRVIYHKTTYWKKNSIYIRTI